MECRRELVLGERHFVSRLGGLEWRLWRLEARRPKTSVPHHPVQLRRREIQAQAAAWIAKDGFAPVPRPLECQHHVAASGDRTRLGQPFGNLLNGHRPAPFEERHDHQVEERALIPVQHVLNARHGCQADPLAVSVTSRAQVAVGAAGHFVAPSFAVGTVGSGINPRRLAASCTSGGIVRASTMKPLTEIIQARGFDSSSARRQNAGSN